MASYDYVIAGAGSAGCALASRLTEDLSVTVLLIEAGGHGRHLFIRMPAANGFVFGKPRFDWSYRTEPQPELDGRRVYWPRGRGLGGSSSINGMIYIRGNARDYDGWRQQGLEGWAYADVLPYFRRSEGNPRGDDHFHGADGPLRTGPAGNVATIDRVFLEAARQAGYPENRDFNGATQFGCGIYDMTVHGGRRFNTAWAYLRRAESRPNLTVMTDARVLEVAFEGTRASGVTVGHGGGRETVRAAREVIVALGAIGSPQLLMLSGLGPADDLRRLGLTVRADLPGVGANLHDHLNVPVQYRCLDPAMTFARYLRADRALALGLRYLLTGGGPGAAPFWSAGAFKAVDPGAEVPSHQVFFTPMVIVEDPRGKDAGAQRHRSFGAGMLTRGKYAVDGFQFDVNPMRPRSRGALRLGSAEARDPPIIDPRYMTEEPDRRDMIEAVRIGREIAHQKAFDAIRGEELSPGAALGSDAEILSGVRRIAISGYHPVGTCKMGIASDSTAVVDAALRVRGVESLRVVDASVMPTLVTGNTNGPTIMIAEKAADMILGRVPLPRAEV
ncbi:MAG: choline dehydrogenase [Alphaproteobacteria bacterium]